MKKIQRNLYVSPLAVRGWKQMAGLVGVAGQRNSPYSELYSRMGEAFAKHPDECAGLVKLILSGRMIDELTEAQNE